MTANGAGTLAAPAAVGPQQALPGARAALILLLAINLFNYIDRQVLAAVIPRIREDPYAAPGAQAAPGQEQSLAVKFVNWLGDSFGLGDNALIGSLSMAFIVSYMIFAPIFGWLGDRMSRWMLVGIAVILWSGASGASGWPAATFGALFLTRCFVGIGEGGYGPIAPTMISDYYPVRIRGSVLAWFYMAIPVGGALGYVLGGLVADSALGWRGAFYLVVPPGLLLGLWCFFMREPPRGQADAVGSVRRARLKDYFDILKIPSYDLDTLGMAGMTFAVGGIAFWMPDYIYARVRGQMNLGTVNILFGAIVVVSGLAATLLGGIAGDRLRPRFPGSYFLVSGAAMLLAFPLVFLIPVTPFPLAWLLVFLAVFCLFFNTGPTNTILANVTHPSVRATGYALNILIIHALGDAISPLVMGVIADWNDKDMGVAIQVVAGVILVSALLWLWGTRYLERDTALAPTRLG
jgi:MFS family permease